MQKKTGSVKNVKERETVTSAQYLELEHCHLVVKVFITFLKFLQKIPLNLRQAAQREPVKDTCCFTALFTAG